MRKLALEWWIPFQILDVGKSFLPITWRIQAADASLTGWEGVLEQRSIQGTWSVEQQTLLINILELLPFCLAQQQWCGCLQVIPVWVQFHNAKVVAYLDYQGGTRSHAAHGKS